MESTFLPTLPTRLMSRWPILVLGALVGALGGLAFSWLTPPVYQSAAAVTVGIDYSRILPLELIVEDRVLDRVRQVALSDDAIESAWERLQAIADDAGAFASPADLRKAIRLDQRLSRWEFLAFDRDPDRAARVANAWSEVALEKLEEARKHADAVQGLEGGAGLVQCTVLNPQGLPEDALWQCVATGAGLEPAALAALQAEVAASRGLIGPLIFEPIEKASPSGEPVLWGRGILVGAGAVLGALAALAAAALWRRPAQTES